MMKRWIIILLVVIALIVLSNTRAAKSMVNEKDESDCSYSNRDGSFTFQEFQFNSRDFAMCQRKFQEFKKQNHTDTVLYRLCKSNYLKFWNYSDYFFDEKFRLPYKSWPEIEEIRGPIDHKTGFQDF
jgi:hypothetical protein